MADLPFVMVMNRSVPKVWESVVQQLPANVRLLEKIPFSESDKLFEGALVLLNTSEFEGFPNTFLQAGKYGVPVLSLSVDPDEFITQTGCGLVCRMIQPYYRGHFAVCVRTARCGRNARRP